MERWLEAWRTSVLDENSDDKVGKVIEDITEDDTNMYLIDSDASSLSVNSNTIHRRRTEDRRERSSTFTLSSDILTTAHSGHNDTENTYSDQEDDLSELGSRNEHETNLLRSLFQGAESPVSVTNTEEVSTDEPLHEENTSDPDVDTASTATFGTTIHNQSVSSKGSTLVQGVYDELINISGLLSERSNSLATREHEITKIEQTMKQRKQIIEQQIQHSLQVEFKKKFEAAVELRCRALFGEQQSESLRLLEKQKQQTQRLRVSYDQTRDINKELRRGLDIAANEINQLKTKLATAKRRAQSLTTAQSARDLSKRSSRNAAGPPDLNDTKKRMNTATHHSTTSTIVDQFNTSTTTLLHNHPRLAPSNTTTTTGSAKGGTRDGTKRASLRVLELALQLLIFPSEKARAKLAVSWVERCRRSLPDIVSLFASLEASSTTLQLPFLEFVHLVLHVSGRKGSATSTATTYRRIGEEAMAILIKPLETLQKAGTTIHGESDDDHDHRRQVRLMASLVAIQTVHQADQLAKAFTVMREGMLHNNGKDLFIRHHGLSILLLPLRLHTRAVISQVSDILLTLTMEPAHFDKVCAELCSDAWLACLCDAFKSTTISGATSNNIIGNRELKLVEKLSVVLQKLSKCGTSKESFPKHGLDVVVRDTINHAGANSNMQFVVMNLKSILLNLNEE
eukprot:m.119789 g.119789  ORF g.119789 m.119789 type:complete len:682 (+) comp28764_c0_seq1:124-2169(+)